MRCRDTDSNRRKGGRWINCLVYKQQQRPQPLLLLFFFFPTAVYALENNTLFAEAAAATAEAARDRQLHDSCPLPATYGKFTWIKSICNNTQESRVFFFSVLSIALLFSPLPVLNVNLWKKGQYGRSHKVILQAGNLEKAEVKEDKKYPRWQFYGLDLASSDYTFLEVCTASGGGSAHIFYQSHLAGPANHLFMTTVWMFVRTYVEKRRKVKAPSPCSLEYERS